VQQTALTDQIVTHKGRGGVEASVWLKIWSRMEAIERYLQTKSGWINTGSGGGNPFSMETAGGRAAAALISRRDERIACTVLSQKART